MRRIMEGLSMYSKPATGGIRRPSIWAVIEATSEVLAYEARSIRSPSGFKCRPCWLKWSVTEVALMQVLVNLATNAVQANGGHRGGQVTLKRPMRAIGSWRADRRGGHRQGPCIAPDALAQIWTPFYTPKRRGQGSDSPSFDLRRAANGRCDHRREPPGRWDHFRLTMPAIGADVLARSSTS